MPGCATGLAQT